MRKVITYGTFDLFHLGHLRLLERAKALGDYLIVGVSTDEFNELKGKHSIFRYEDRAEIVANMRFVDQVVPEHSWEQKRRDILTHGASVFVMGDDWAGKFDEFKDVAEVVYLPRTPSISTTLTKQWISPLSDSHLKALKDATELLVEVTRQLA